MPQSAQVGLLSGIVAISIGDGGHLHLKANSELDSWAAGSQALMRYTGETCRLRLAGDSTLPQYDMPCP